MRCFKANYPLFYFAITMLNRRLLRIRAMQHIYAYQRCRQANYELAFDFVREAFAPDLNSMEVQDLEELGRQKEQATQLLKARLEGQLLAGKASSFIEQTVNEALRGYESQCRKDQRFLQNQMVARTEKMGDYYLRFLLLPEMLLAEAERDGQKKLASAPSSHAPEPVRLANNRLLLDLRESEQFQQVVQAKQLSWEAYRSEVHLLYKNAVKSDTQYWAYQALAEPTREDDVALIRHVVSTLALNHEAIINIFEEEGGNWEEDKKIVKSLINRTFKSWEKGEDSTVEIASLTPNWEDDRAFFEELYDLTIRNDEEYEQLISDTSKNWAADRIASLDNVIMKMAIVEMIHFRSIPVKVTINEYVDISKLYSTQKSRQFINGMLDVIAQDLQKKNMIRKSGRGLMDNQ